MLEYGCGTVRNNIEMVTVNMDINMDDGCQRYKMK